MFKTPHASVIVTTFERPSSLSLVLTSLACQDFGRDYEVVVADDGSRDETSEIVQRHQASSSFPIKFVTHPHRAFELARCRNEGMLASSAPYLIFLDGDCLAPSNFLSQHLKLREVQQVVAGFTCHLDREATLRCGTESIVSGAFQKWVAADSHRKLRRLDWKSTYYRLTNHSNKPRLRGGNFGVWRSDFEKVNGFDEAFVGWGCEDDDFGMRIRRTGVHINNAFRAVPTYHLWHSPVNSTPQRWRQGANVEYFEREVCWTRCLRGIEKRRPQDLRFSMGSDREYMNWIGSLLEPARRQDDDCWARPDIEVLISSANARFKRRADCNVLVVPDRFTELPLAARQADVILADHRVRTTTNSVPQFPLNGFRDYLRTVFNHQHRQIRKVA